MSQAGAAPAAYCEAGSDHRVLDCDDLYLSVLQRERADVVGRHPLELTFQIDRELNASMLKGLASDGAAFTITKRYVRGDGSLIWVTNHVAPLAGNGPSRVCAICKPVASPVDSAGLARNLEAVRRLSAAFVLGRRAIGADIVSAPAIEILLRLYAAELEGTEMTGDGLAKALDLFSASTLRWLLALVQRGLVDVEHDAPVTLSASFRVARRCELAFDEIIACLPRLT